MKSAIVLLSGGLDSITSLAISRRLYSIDSALTFDYGQRAAAKEIAAARYFCDLWQIPHRSIELPWLKEVTKTALVDRSVTLENLSAAAVWVPNRNGIFINIAAAFCETKKIDIILTGFNVEEASDFPDNSAEFVEKMNASLKLSTLSHPTVVSPTLSLSKKEILAKAIAMGLPIDRLWPCYEGGTKLCGFCTSCEKTTQALKSNGVFEKYKGMFAP